MTARQIRAERRRVATAMREEGATLAQIAAVLDITVGGAGYLTRDASGPLVRRSPHYSRGQTGLRHKLYNKGLRPADLRAYFAKEFGA